LDAAECRAIYCAPLLHYTTERHMQQQSLIRLPEVRQQVGLSRSEIYRRIARKEFPAPVPLGARAVAWVKAEVDGYVQNMVAAREQSAQQHSEIGKRLVDAKRQRAAEREAKTPVAKSARRAGRAGHQHAHKPEAESQRQPQRIRRAK
jgi:prophage regulatory protein